VTRLERAAYRLVLRVFPSEFRRRHGDAMRDQFQAERLAVAGRPVSIAWLWVRALADAIRHGLACRVEARQTAGGGRLRSLTRDLRHTWRAVRVRPAATAATVGVLGLGIGLTSAIFALADPFLLRPLPYADPDRLAIVSLHSENRRPGPFPTLADFEARRDLFAAVAAYTPLDSRRLRVRLPEGDAMVNTAVVSRSFFTVLGVPIALPADWEAASARGETPLVLLPGADPRLRDLPLGTAVPTQDGEVLRIVGMVPPGFVFPRGRVSSPPVAIAPLTEGSLLDVRIGANGRSFSSTSKDVIARLNAGVSPELVESVLGPPESETRAYSLTAHSLRQQMTAHLEGLAVGTFAAGLLMALGCAANLANLLAARGAFRAAELATRTALGASRFDLARLALVELAVLTLAGVAAGLASAHVALGVAGAVLPAEYAALGAPAVTGRVAAFAVGLGTMIMAVGVVPALTAWRLTPAAALAPRAVVDSRRVRALRFVMTAGQSAVAMLLLAGAALLGRSFLHLVGQDTGFAGDPVVVSVSYSSRHDADALQRDIDATIERLRRLPGVTTAAAATGVGMVDGSMAGTVVLVNGKARLISTKQVTPGYFEAVGASIVAGRPLEERDGAMHGLVVNRRAAAELWPDGTALGRPIVRGKITATVVGVVADTFDQALDVQPGAMLFSVLQPPSGSRVSFILRTSETADALRQSAERAVTETNRDAIVMDVSGIGDRLAASVRDRLFATMVGMMFAGAGVGVCAFGLIGVVSFMVARRTREIAIRTAIGAEPRHVRRLVMRQALTAALTGTSLGLTLGWWSSRWLESLLYGVEAGDAATLGAGAVVMLAIVGAASWFPARRALGLSPTIALRAE
jgi:predicted permease